MHRFLRSLLGVGCLTCLVSCSSGGGSETTPQGGEIAAPAGLGGTTIVMTHIEPDPVQDEILADGRVSVAEMERALLAVVPCVEDRGYAAELQIFEEYGSWGFFVASDGSQGANDAASQALRDCEWAMLSEITEPYLDEHGLTDHEEEEWLERTRQCLADKGYDVDDVVTSFGQLGPPASDPQDFSECRHGTAPR